MKISKILIEWYKKNARNLPWRAENDPYRTWLSEIIFQQTRIDQGLSYYLSFVNSYPDLVSLASASEKEVLRLWQGLGYYSRARNMLETARLIHEKYNDSFPGTYEELIKLKGIGPYTAAAIASIAFNEVVPAIDGNVIRVISRLYAVDLAVDSGEGRKLIRELAEKIVDKDNPGDFNEAMMDLGAMVCTPRNPDCRICPLNTYCKALETGKPDSYPLKQKKAITRVRWFYYLHIRINDNMVIHNRTGRDIWKGLYDLPLIESEAELPAEKLLKKITTFPGIPGDQEIILTMTNRVKHQLSHQTLFIHFISLKLNEPFELPGDNYLLIPEQDINSYPVPVVIANYINKVWKS